MKFQLLPLGARFEFEGKIYSKSGPMTASGPSGEQKMIPRYADLTPMDGNTTQRQPPPPRLLNPGDVQAAFDAFYAEVAERVDTRQLGALAMARKRFLDSLGIEAGTDR